MLDRQWSSRQFGEKIQIVYTLFIATEHCCTLEMRQVRWGRHLQHLEASLKYIILAVLYFEASIFEDGLSLPHVTAVQSSHFSIKFERWNKTCAINKRQANHLPIILMNDWMSAVLHLCQHSANLWEQQNWLRAQHRQPHIIKQEDPSLACPLNYAHSPPSCLPSFSNQTGKVQKRGIFLEELRIN